MKKTAKWLAIAATFLAVMFASCSNGLNDATVTGPGITEKRVTLYANSDSDIVIFANDSENTARTIMPGTIDGTASKYKFYLWGTDKLGILSDATKLATPSEVNFKAETGSTTKGSVNLDLEVSQYELCLAVLDGNVNGFKAPTTGDDAISKALLYATATVDFRSSDSVNFFLSPYKLTAGGGFELSIVTDGEWTVPDTHTVTVGVYDINNETAIPGTKEDNKFSISTNAETYKSDSTTSVTPGTYNFVLKLVPTVASGLKKTYYYSDKIVILSNQVTEGTIKIPNIITTKPTAPQAFGVSYLDPLNEDSDYYEVQFVWKDKSYNEDNFKLELLDYTKFPASADSALSTHISALSAATGASSSSLDTSWSTLRGSTYLPNEVLYTFDKIITKTVSNNASVPGEYFYNNPEFWIDGSLNRNSEMAVIRLPLGRRYFARLCAVNDVGSSDYLYVDISGTTVTEAKNYNRYGSTAVNSTSLKKFGAKTVDINRFRITYNLNDGIFYKTDSDTSYTKRVSSNTELTGIVDLNHAKTAVVKYGTHKLEDATDVSTIFNPLHATDGQNTPNYGMLHDGDLNKWTNWLVGSANGTIYAPSATITGADAHDGYKDNSEKTTAAAPATPAPVWTEAKYTGFENLDLYATYRISNGITRIDESANYNIKSEMVKVFSNTTSSFPSPATACSPVEGVYKFVNSTTADANAPTGSVAAKYLYVALVNDAANNYIGGTPVSYDKIVMKVLKNGITQKQSSIATASSSISYTGKKSDGSDSSTATANYITIPIAAYSAGKYAVQIHAYANTQQGEYTYTLYFEVTDPSGTPAAPTPTFNAETKTFTFTNITTKGALTAGPITDVTSASTAVLTASVDSGTVTVTSVAAGTSDVTITDSASNTQKFTFTVADDGSISVTEITLN